MKRFTVLLAFLVFVFSGIFAQNVQITGNVTGSEDGAPLPGVSVVVKGTTVGTVTDFNGYYVLSVPEDATTLVFSFVGMQTQEVPIDGRTTIDVVLNPDALDLEEVVVTAIGIKREAKALGYSVQNVGADEIENSENTSVLNSLAGRVAGVSINSSSGAAGASTFIEIRGASSITRSNRPLFVVDGVPIQGGGGAYGVNGVATSDRAIDINPDDIQDITVLKGGAATALYGLRAANGAIVITTKSGEAGAKKTKVEFNTSVTIENVSMLPELQDEFAQGSKTYSEYLDWIVDYYYGTEVQHSQVASPADGAPYRNLSWGPHVSELSYTTDPAFTDSGDGWYYGYIPMDEYLNKWDSNGRIVPADSPFANGQPVKTYDQYDFFQTGISYNNNLSLSGGNDNTTYYFSVSNVNTEGVIPNNTFDRTTFKLSANTKLSDKFSTGASVNYITNSANRIQQGSNISGIMLGLLRTPPTFDNSAGYEFADGTQRNYRGGPGYDNPYWTSNNIAYKDDLHRMIGNFNFNYYAAPWLSFTYRLGTDTYTTSVKDQFAINSNEYPAGRVYTDRYTSTDINSDLLMNINTDLTQDLTLGVTIGHNMYQRETNYVNGVANGLDIPGFYNMRNSSDVIPSEGTFKKRTAAFFGDFGLSFQDMIFINFTDRLEWSTTLPVEESPFNYWSASAGFVFTELPMLQGNSVLPFGKLRVSYAQVANDAAAYSNATYYVQAGAGDGWSTIGMNYPFTNPLGSFSGFTYSGVLGDPLLGPELQNTFEVGADLRFFNGRFGIDAAYFKNVNDDLLLSVPVASSSGFAARYTNAGAMETEGIELLVNLTPVKTNDFSWDIIVTWSNPTSTVTRLAEGVPNISLGGFVDPSVRAVAGDPYRSVYGTQLLKAETGELIINDEFDLEDPALNPYANYNRGIYGYPMQDLETAPLGNIQADWIGGLTNTFRFGGLSLTALIDVKQGGLMWNGTRGALYYFGTHADTETRDDDPYVHEGLRGHLNSAGEIVHYADPENGDFTEIPGPGAANTVARADDEYYRFWSGIGSGFTGPAEQYMEEADWVRLREITLSYTVPANVLQGTFIDNLDVYVTGRNLWISTPYTGIDPETSLLGTSNGQGFDYFNQPGTKGFTFGLRLGF